MGNQPAEYKCPKHPQSNIKKICVHQECIQPVCDDCLIHHRQKHNVVGILPELRSLDQISKALTQSHKHQSQVQSKLSEFGEPVRRLSTEETIKEYTREYFLRKRETKAEDTQISIHDIINNIQLADKLKDATTQESIRSFLKVHLKVNEEVVDKQFQPLY